MFKNRNDRTLTMSVYGRSCQYPAIKSCAISDLFTSFFFLLSVRAGNLVICRSSLALSYSHIVGTIHRSSGRARQQQGHYEMSDVDMGDGGGGEGSCTPYQYMSRFIEDACRDGTFVKTSVGDRFVRSFLDLAVDAPVDDWGGIVDSLEKVSTVRSDRTSNPGLYRAVRTAIAMG